MEKTDITISSANRHSSSSNDNSNVTTNLTIRQNITSTQNYTSITMEELLKQAQFTFLHIVNTQIINLLENAKGIAFVKLLSLGVGDIIGNGIVMKHDTLSNIWHGPCAVSCTGVSMRGNGVGVEEINAVLLINDENFFPFLLQNSPNSNKTIVSDMTIVVGTLQDKYTASNIPKITSYSFSKGVYVDFAFEKISIIIDNKINHDYYQTSVQADDIFNGKIKPIDDKNYFELCKQLTSCVNDWKKKHQESLKYGLNTTPLFQYYMGNYKNVEYNYQQLSQLPLLPFMSDIKNKKYNLRHTKGWVLGKKISLKLKKMFQFQNDNNKNDNKTEAKKFVFDANMPLYHYYSTKEAIKYDSKQLNALPKFPFLDDVRSYHKIELWKNYFVKDTKNVHDKRKYFFDEKSPLYQYYKHDENLKEVKYNYQILSKLPKFPFLDDVKSNKFYLKQYNPINIIKKKMKTHEDNQKKLDKKSVEKQWHFDPNIPLYQFYLDSNEVQIYDQKQLSALPTYPFLNDVKSQKFKLQNFNPIEFVKNFYSKYIATSNK